MKSLSFEVTLVIIGFAVFGVGGCQDVKLDSTQNSGMEQTEPSGTVDGSQQADVVPKVDLEMLARPRPNAYTQGRDPFRFGSVSTGVRTGGIAEGGIGEDFSGAASPSEENRANDDSQLNMIGIVRNNETEETIAILTDGDVVLYGRKGEIIDGRYRILDVMPTAVKIEFVHSGLERLVELSDF
jgi:hypothetical protein